MKKLYFVVEKETDLQVNENVETCTGNKKIWVYEIALDTPHLWFELEVDNTDNSVEKINEWLDDNGFSERGYEIIQL